MNQGSLLTSWKEDRRVLKHYHHAEKWAAVESGGEKYDLSLRWCLLSRLFKRRPRALPPFTPPLLPPSSLPHPTHGQCTSLISLGAEYLMNVTACL